MHPEEMTTDVSDLEAAPRPRVQTLQRSRKRTKAGRYTSDITYEELSRYFHLPTEQACRHLGVGLTILKRVCRRLGLPRWPYRKPVKSQISADAHVTRPPLEEHVGYACRQFGASRDISGNGYNPRSTKSFTTAYGNEPRNVTTIHTYAEQPPYHQKGFRPHVCPDHKHGLMRQDHSCVGVGTSSVTRPMPQRLTSCRQSSFEPFNETLRSLGISSGDPPLRPGELRAPKVPVGGSLDILLTALTEYEADKEAALAGQTPSFASAARNFGAQGFAMRNAAEIHPAPVADGASWQSGDPSKRPLIQGPHFAKDVLKMMHAFASNPELKRQVSNISSTEQAQVRAPPAPVPSFTGQVHARRTTEYEAFRGKEPHRNEMGVPPYERRAPTSAQIPWQREDESQCALREAAAAQVHEGDAPADVAALFQAVQEKLIALEAAEAAKDVRMPSQPPADAGAARDFGSYEIDIHTNQKFEVLQALNYALEVNAWPHRIWPTPITG